jgi:predicted RNA binding protein YcfA (HicA-like mRNA interferase family)
MKVRDAIERIEGDGWFLVATRGSHRQFKHSVKPGRVTICREARRRFGTRHLE